MKGETVQGIFRSFKGPLSKARVVALSCLNECTHCLRIPFYPTLQVDLLLGKAYSKWGRVSDAVSVYNQLISTYPDDFRGYLAKVLPIWSLYILARWLFSFFSIKSFHDKCITIF